MKKEKQQKVLEAIKKGGYTVYPSGKVERRGNMLAEVIRPDGYVQWKFYAGKGKYVMAYAHEVMWLVTHGKFPENKRVSFKDGDNSNVSLDNLELVNRKIEEKKLGIVRPVRKTEIDSIRFYLRGGERNYSRVARELDLTRSAVARTAKKLLNGEFLKFDTTEPIVSPYNKIEIWKKKQSQKRQAA